MAAFMEFKGSVRFRVIRRIGDGGMGVVYEAFDRERGQKIAIKTLRQPDAETLYRLKREFRSLAELSHPNLVALHELFTEGEDCFFTMDLLQGVDFLTWARGPAPERRHTPTAKTTELMPQSDLHSGAAPHQTPGGRCDEGRLRAALPQLAAGLSALHGARKVHRDVKPSNILVSASGHVTLLDFGLVAEQEFDPDLLEGHVTGTLAYMAPEQCRGDVQLTPATDWYAVGGLLYEALTGRLPFEGASVQLLEEKQRYNPVPPRALFPGVPADLDELCVALLEREPRHRPTGEEVLRRLGYRRSIGGTRPRFPSASTGADTSRAGSKSSSGSMRRCRRSARGPHGSSRCAVPPESARAR